MQRVAIIGYGFAGKSFHAYLVGLADGLERRADRGLKQRREV